MSTRASEEVGPRAGPRRLRVVAVAGAVIGVAVAAVLVWQLRDGSDRDPSLPLPAAGETVVPDVRGLAPIDAAETLARWGLAHAVNDGDSLRENARVVAQEPGAGQEVPIGSVVGLRTRDDTTSLSVGRVGAPVHVDGWTVVVADYETVERFDGVPAAAGTRWFVVRGTATNGRQEARLFNAAGRVELGDAQLRHYLVAEASGGDHLVRTGESLPLTLAFSIPEDAAGFRLHLGTDMSTELSAGRAAVVNLSCC